MRLPRPCKRCCEIFQPTGKVDNLCEKCKKDPNGMPKDRYNRDYPTALSKKYQRIIDKMKKQRNKYKDTYLK